MGTIHVNRYTLLEPSAILKMLFGTPSSGDAGKMTIATANMNANARYSLVNATSLTIATATTTIANANITATVKTDFTTLPTPILLEIPRCRRQVWDLNL